MHNSQHTVTKTISRIIIPAVFLTLASCSSQSSKTLTEPDAARAIEPMAEPVYVSSLIENVPHIQQKPDFCGEACAAMYLNYLGETVDQDYVFDAASVNPALGRGLITRELNDALKEIGFETGTVWTQVRAQRDVHRQFTLMIEDLSKEIPSIVCMNTTGDASNTEHFRLILGYDANTAELIYHEPAERNGAYKKMAAQTFIRLWPLKADGRPDTVVRMKLKPGALAFGEKSTERTAADYAQHVIAKKSDIPGAFHVVVEPPFVVIGNGSYDQVAAHARRTVRWTVKLLKKDFFSKDPEKILDVWVFEDAQSYRYYAEKLFGDIPDTPYGYYSPSSEALVMNIGLGGGTLVHEIVHPFMETNFPDCPSWFNEGLGSLYEWSEDKNGRIYGVVNWRLDGLRDDIRNQRLGSFERLMKLSHNEFYADDTGANYAQSRFLLQYLQFKGKLREFFRRFVKDHVSDPSGIETLQDLLKITDMGQFQTHWENWVITLKKGSVPLENGAPSNN